ncbi:MAG: cobalt transporter CbiM [Candidatus Sumerlaeaceae bacterium]|nr:cobalt transporter CbiM [Candidatus Sumerlaeaceae bacterium]
MHIPDGYLGPKTWATCYALVAPFWWHAWRYMRTRLATMEIPHVALASAFVFVVMMFNVPLPGGTTGHVVGASLVAIALGVWPAVLAVSLALAIQCFVFGDGGITALGANCLNMAVIQVFVTAGVWNFGRPKDLQANPTQTFGAAFAAGYVGLVAAAFATSVQFGLQPVLERTADGTPLYCPFPLRIAVPVMVISHLLVGIMEGAVTGFAILALARNRSAISTDMQLAPRPGLYKSWRFWVSAAVVVLLVPVGIFLPHYFGAGDAWGEWSPEDLAKEARMAEPPAGLAKNADLWNPPVPDYAFSPTESKAVESVQYIVAAIAGVILISLVFLLLGRLQRRRLGNIPPPGTHAAG